MNVTIFFIMQPNRGKDRGSNDNKTISFIQILVFFGLMMEGVRKMRPFSPVS